jgi:hypothetical protein
MFLVEIFNVLVSLPCNIENILYKKKQRRPPSKKKKSGNKLSPRNRKACHSISTALTMQFLAHESSLS